MAFANLPHMNRQLLLCHPVLGLLTACLLGTRAAGQDLDFRAPGAPSEPLLPRAWDLARWTGTGDSDRPAGDPLRSMRLFGMPTGFLSQPVGADLDPDVPPSEDAAPPEPGGDLPVLAAMWNDNPYFDFRRPGDVGGYGYYRIHSQLQLLGTQRTGCSLGMQAVTPAGLESDGIAEGPTVVAPHFALFHEVSDGTAVQAFVGKDLRVIPRLDDRFGGGFRYGMAVAQRVPGFDGGTLPYVHVFLEALGRYRIDGESSPGGGPAVWELLPGLHWRVGDSCWVSGGVLMPLGASHIDLGLWQLTCSWQF